MKSDEIVVSKKCFWEKDVYKRQGESQFFISLEDDLMRLFGSEKLMDIFNTCLLYTSRCV